MPARVVGGGHVTKLPGSHRGGFGAFGHQRFRRSPAGIWPVGSGGQSASSPRAREEAHSGPRRHAAGLLCTAAWHRDPAGLFGGGRPPPHFSEGAPLARGTRRAVACEQPLWGAAGARAQQKTPAKVAVVLGSAGTKHPNAGRVVVAPTWRRRGRHPASPPAGTAGGPQVPRLLGLPERDRPGSRPSRSGTGK